MPDLHGVVHSLILGDGSDEHPFILSMCSKALLSVLSDANNSLIPIVFRMDSTFKCNENEFPVTLLGISDANRQFYLLSISIVSHCTCQIYLCLISSLQELVEKVMPGIIFNFKYCMTDCEVTEWYVNVMLSFIQNLPLNECFSIFYGYVTYGHIAGYEVSFGSEQFSKSLCL